MLSLMMPASRAVCTMAMDKKMSKETGQFPSLFNSRKDAPSIPPMLHLIYPFVPLSCPCLEAHRMATGTRSKLSLIHNSRNASRKSLSIPHTPHLFWAKRSYMHPKTVCPFLHNAASSAAVLTRLRLNSIYPVNRRRLE